MDGAGDVYGGRAGRYSRSIMAGLSDLLLRTLGVASCAPSDIPLRIGLPNDQKQRLAGIRLILGHSSGPAGSTEAQGFLESCAERGIDAARLIVAEQTDQILWAVLPVSNPGRTALLIAPGIRPENLIQRRAAVATVQAALDIQRLAGAQLAQILVDPHDSDAIALYCDGCGLTRLAELFYLRMKVRRLPNPGPAESAMRWHTYSPDRHELFKNALLASYENTLDCPGLGGRRDMDDVIIGHRATGDHDPELWFVVTHGDDPTPAGILLLAPMSKHDSMELIYLGLSPAFRGRRIGAALMRRAMLATQERSLARLCLAVDSLNIPALKLYYRHGMERVGSRVALIRPL